MACDPSWKSDPEFTIGTRFLRHFERISFAKWAAWTLTPVWGILQSLPPPDWVCGPRFETEMA